MTIADLVAELRASCHIVDEDQVQLAVDRRLAVHQSTRTILHASTIFAIIGFILCLVLLGLILYALVKRRIPSRKFSVVVSRTVGDMISCTLIATASLLASESNTAYAVLTLFLYIATFGCLLLGLSHIYVILLRQLSVTRPYGFQSLCNMRRITTAIVISWIASVLYTLAFSPLASVVIDPKNSANDCSYGRCQKPLLIVAICLISLLLLVVCVSYLSVLWKLKKTAHSERMHNEPEVTKKKMWKFLAFGCHIALFLFIMSLVLTGAIFILHNVWLYNSIRSLVEQKRDCQIAQYLDTIVRLDTVAGGVVLLWLVRVYFDVIIVFFTDYTRLIPWLDQENLQPLTNNQIVSRAQSLRWQKGSLNCPVFNIDAHFHPWDFKN